MKTKIVFAFAVTGMAVAVMALWLQVRSLEASVDRLTQQLLASPHIQSIVTQPSAADPITERKKSPFKMIEVSNVGVPWEIEHAMIGDGDQQSAAVQR
jgi:hypothetical protein